MKKTKLFFFLLPVAMALSASVHGGQMFPIVTNDTAATGLTVACAGSNYLAGINGDFVSNGEYEITAQLFGPDGTPVGARINPVPGHTSGNTFGAFVASAGTNFLMVWPDDYLCTNGYDNINAQIVSPSGDLVGGWFAITTNAQQGFTTPEPVAYGAGVYLMVWDDYSSGSGYASIYGQIVSANGAPVGGNFLICAPFNGAQEEKSATVAFDGTNFLVTWFNVLAVNDQNVVYGAFVSPSGTVGTPFAISQTVSAERNPLYSVYNGTNYFVVWNFASQPGGLGSTNYVWSVHGRFVTPAGTFPVNEFGIVTNANKTLPCVAFDGVNYLLAWEPGSGAANPGPEFQFLNAGGQPIGTQFTPFSSQGNEVPLAANLIYDGNRFVSVATLAANGMSPTNDAGVYGAFIPASATPKGALKVTLTGGGAGAEWQVDTNGSYLKSGLTVSNLAAGSHTVSFKPVTGWNTPTNQSLTITAGAITKAAAVYTTKEKPVLTLTSPKSGASVSSAQLTVTGTVKDDVAVASVNYQVNGRGGWSPATITGTGTNWTQAVTLTPGSNTVSLYARDIYGNLSLTNSVSIFYTVLAQPSVMVYGPGKVSPNYNSSNLVIGKPYSMTATPVAGCKLTDWAVSVNSSAPVVSNPLTLKFIMAAGMSITANFRDVTTPTISLTAPASTKSSNSVVMLSGKANDNVGVQSVYYTVNSGPVNGAVVTTNGYTNWTAVLILSPGTNVVRFYAADAAIPTPNISHPATVTLVDQSGGFAPQSLSDVNLTLNPLTPQPDNPGNMFIGMSTFAYVYSSSNFYVGDYVFSMLDSNTVQISHQAISPVTGDPGSVTLMFTSSTNGIYTNSHGDGGTFALGGAAGAAPSSVDGAKLQMQSALNADFAYAFTNGAFSFGPLPFAGAGIYTWALYSPQMALLTATFTNAGSIGQTNFVLLNFADGSYDSEWAGPAGTSYDQGAFSITPSAKVPIGYAPESLAGWKVAATVLKTETNGTVKRGTSVICFGAATTGEIDTLGTSYYSEAGNYTYTRTGPNTGFVTSSFTTPPPNTGTGGGLFVFTSPTSGNFTNGNLHGAFTLSKQTATVPASLVGRTLTFTSASFDVPAIVVKFGYDTLSSSVGGLVTAKSYVFGQYGPQVAQMEDWDAFKTNYFTLWFSTPTSGSFVVAAIQSSGGAVSISNGTFKSP